MIPFCLHDAYCISTVSFVSSEEQLRQLVDYLAVRQEPEPSDAIFVFGSVLLTAVWKQAEELFRRGLAPVIVTTGHAGPNARSLGIMSEGRFLAEKLVAFGIPSSAIFFEEKSTNTLENVIFGMNVLEENGIMAKKVLLVAKPFHMRRCLATFAKQFPSVRAFSCPPVLSFEEMIDRPFNEFANRVVGEVDRLIKYGNDGRSIVPQEIPKYILKAADVLRPLFAE